MRTCKKHMVYSYCHNQNPWVIQEKQMVDVAQLVRAPDCGSGGRGFESHLPPYSEKPVLKDNRFYFFER